MFKIAYTIKVTLSLIATGETVDLSDNFTTDLNLPDEQLYENFHVLEQGNILDILRDKVDDYLATKRLTRVDIDVESYEILSQTDDADIFFENPDNPNEYTLTPTIKAYVHSAVLTIVPPVMKGELINSTSIMWSWDATEEKGYAHYLLDDKDVMIAQLPVDLNYYIESALKTETMYIRKLVRYNANSSSKASVSVSITTEENQDNNKLKTYSDIVKEKANQTTQMQDVLETLTDIKVLEVYPYISVLKDWISAYGMGIFIVDSVTIESFNANPSMIWNYDVVVFGFADSNNGKDLTALASSETEKYILANNGVLFGHDTLRNGVLNGFSALAKYVDITFDTTVGSTNWYGLDSANSKVKIVNDGMLTTFPYAIGATGTILTVPLCHTVQQIANGTTWMKFVDKKDPTFTQLGNFYLTTYNNAAMIQCGHSVHPGAISTDYITTDEQKLLVNTLFYLVYSTTIKDRDFKEASKKLEAFHSGVGDGNDLLVAKQSDDDFYEKFGLDMEIAGVYHKNKIIYDQVSFNYSVKASGQYITREQPGYIDILLHAYPVEYITYRIYKYGLRPVTGNYRVMCDCHYFIKVVTISVDSEGNPTTVITYTPAMKTFTSAGMPFSFTGTATYIPKLAFATCNYLDEDSAKPISSLTLDGIMAPLMKSDSTVNASGKPYTSDNYQVQDDYQFTENNNYLVGGARQFGNGVNGTLKTCAKHTNGNDRTSLVYVYGFSEACLCEVIKFVTHEINLLEGTKAMLARSELVTGNLVNISDASLVMSSTDSSVITIAEVSYIEEDVVNDFINVNADPVATCHINPDGPTAHMESDRLTYDFSSDDPYTMEVACYTIKAMDATYNIDPVTRLPINVFRKREYMFVPEIFVTSGNIDIGLNLRVVVGQYITYRGESKFGITLFSNLVDVTNVWEMVLPNLASTDALFGIVNGRFDITTAFMGKNDLVVVAPTFQIPTNVIPATVRFDTIITNVLPVDAFVSALFTNEDSDNYGTKNADILTFSSDSMTEKSIQYTDLIKTVREYGLEMFSISEKVFRFVLTKPTISIDKTYESLNLSILSDNNNIIVSSAPTQIVFDTNDEYKLVIKVKGQQNATTHWNPRVHNGYYYLNNHEHFLYSEFQADGDFRPIQSFMTDQVHYSITCALKNVGGQMTHYEVTKKQQHEFISDLTIFDFENALLFPKPTLDTKYYKEYAETTYISPTITIPETATTYDSITWEENIPINSYMSVWMRVFNVDDSGSGTWENWTEVTNGQPMNLSPSTSMQFKVVFDPSTKNVFTEFDEIECCGIDYSETMDTVLSKNISLIDDIMKCSNSGAAQYYSMVLDYGSSTAIRLSSYDNGKGITMWAAGSNNKDDLTNSPQWIQLIGSNYVGAFRYLRYRIDIPVGGELYLLYRGLNTPVTTCYVPKIGNIDMKFTHVKPDAYYTFTQDFDSEIPFDTEWHDVGTISSLIAPIIATSGFDVSDIITLTVESKDKVSEIETGDISTNSNETAKMVDIFNTWKRFSHSSTTTAQPASVSEMNAWAYDASTDSIMCNINSNTYIGFVSAKTYSKYNHTVNVRSTDGDDDIIGVVIAFAVDSSGVQHTLSAIRTSNVSSQDFKNAAGKNVQWGIFYDYNGFGAKKLIADGSGSVTPATGGWASNPNGSVIFIKRIDNMITAKTSQLNSLSLDDGTVLTVDLTSDPLLSVFQGPQSYGYSCCSQMASSFKDITFINIDAVYGEIDIRSLAVKYDTSLKSQYINFINNTCVITGIPQQFCPVVVEDDTLGALQLVSFYDENGNQTLTNVEAFESISQKSFKLNYNYIDIKTLVVKLNSVIVDSTMYNIYNNIIEFNNLTNYGDIINVTYKIRNSFMVESDIVSNKTTVTANADSALINTRVMFETNLVDNKNIVEQLSFNPIYNLDNKGFIYICDEIFPALDFTIHSNPYVLKADGKDTTGIYVAVTDIYNNPVPGETLTITCKNGTITASNYMTDTNGVVAIRYTAPFSTCSDIITVVCSSINLTKTITIINK